MTWPWVARSTLEAVQDERDRLRVQVDKLTDHVTRMERLEKGAPELAPQPRKPIPPIPDELKALIAEVGSDANRLDLERRAIRRYQRDGTWENVIRDMQIALEAE